MYQNLYHDLALTITDLSRCAADELEQKETIYQKWIIYKKEGVCLETLDIIIGLLEKNHISQKKFLNDIGLNATAMSEWKAGRNQSYFRASTNFYFSAL